MISSLNNILFYSFFFDTVLHYPDDEEGENYDEELSERDEQAGKEG